MEKLIKLLNEHAKKLGIGDYVGWHNEKTVRNSEYIITKKFGFIKWLVDNDKIELPTSCAIDKNNDYSEREIKSDYESLLMLLTIQDEPIDFLISVLK